jgi:molybdopterin/thiamine biosynthesis adenylyltransferase
MSYDPDGPISLSDPGQDRYATLRLIDWWRQEVISQACVMVVGAGALGNEVLKNLALLGVGHLVIVDCDLIEVANLTRSVLFRLSDCGQAKAEVAAARVRALNGDVQVRAVHADITRDIGLGVYRRMDVVIGCLDNRAARIAVNAACWHVEKPWIDGALESMDGMVQVFSPPQSACYECTLTTQDYALLYTRYSCPADSAILEGHLPTMPTAASLIAALQVQEAIKILHRQPVQAGRAVYYTAANMQLTPLIQPRRQNCPVHTRFTPIVSLAQRVQDLTLARLLDLVRAHLGTEGLVYLPHPLVTTLSCPHCRRQEEVYRPEQEVLPAALPCPLCRTQRLFTHVSVLATNGPLRELARPLSQLGIPALHILPVRARTGWSYLELSADEQEILPWSAGRKGDAHPT